MRRVFVLAGELSGDRVAAWYIKRRRDAGEHLDVSGIGGDALVSAGAVLFARFETLNCSGVIEILRHVPRLMWYMLRVVHHLIAGEYDELILVDFPGFNLRLARLARRALPHLSITYLAPPQLWIWGRWRARTLRSTCSSVVVLYQHEVAFYRERGITAHWYGYPWYADFAQFREPIEHKERCIALIVGSRAHELDMLLPLYAETIRSLRAIDPAVRFVIPRAESISHATLELALRRHRLAHYGEHIDIVAGEARYERLARCAFAVTKPGTITLELALLGTPALVVFRTSNLSFYIGKFLARVSFMALPNLLSSTQLLPEYIQQECGAAAIAAHAQQWFIWARGGDPRYTQLVERLSMLDSVLR